MDIVEFATSPVQLHLLAAVQSFKKLVGSGKATRDLSPPGNHRPNLAGRRAANKCFGSINKPKNRPRSLVLIPCSSPSHLHVGAEDLFRTRCLNVDFECPMARYRHLLWALGWTQILKPKPGSSNPKCQHRRGPSSVGLWLRDVMLSLPERSLPARGISLASGHV